MEVLIRSDSVEISGYVNAIERKSKPIPTRMGSRFVERICKGAFKRSLERDDDVKILLNHDKNHELGGIRQGNLELTEDSIGLHARAVVTDKGVIDKARNHELIGWSFGFMDRDVDNKTDEDGMTLRDVKDLDLKEVSILDKDRTPAYDGTLLSVRSDESIYYGEVTENEVTTREVTNEQDKPAEVNINYDKWDELVADMKK